MCFHAEKGIKGIGRVRPHKRSAANLKRLTRFLDVTREPERSEGLDGKPLSSAFTQSSVPSPQSCMTARRVAEWKMFVMLILRLNRL